MASRGSSFSSSRRHFCSLGTPQPSSLMILTVRRFNSIPTASRVGRFRPGDGTATMDFRQGGDSYASILVDGTRDKRGIWWALIERKVSDKMDLSLMQKPGHEFRI